MSKGDAVFRKIPVLRFNFGKEPFHRRNGASELPLKPGFLYFARDVVAVMTGESLTLLGEHAVTVEVSPCADVHHNLKSVVGIFKRSSDFLPALGSTAEIVRCHALFFFASHFSY